MSTVEKSIRLYAWKSNYQTVQMVQGEMDSRTFRIQLFDTTAPVDLTRCSVKLYAEKPDSTKVYLNCEPVDAKNGIVEVVIEEQVAAVPGVVNCWIQVVGTGGTDLRFEGLYIEVSKCDLDGATESTGSKDDIRAFMEESARLAEVQNEVRSARMGHATLLGKEQSQDQALADTASAIRREMDANDVDVRNDFANADAVLQSHINAEKARIDQLTASPEIGEGDLEKEMGDLRVGDDGVAYGSAGTMTRTRLSVRNVKAVKLTELPDVVLPVQEVQQAIEQKGEEVMKSLPEDYTELVEEVSKLSSEIANVNEITTDIEYAQVLDSELKIHNGEGQLFLYTESNPKQIALDSSLTFCPYTIGCKVTEGETIKAVGMSFYNSYTGVGIVFSTSENDIPVWTWVNGLPAVDTSLYDVYGGNTEEAWRGFEYEVVVPSGAKMVWVKGQKPEGTKIYKKTKATFKAYTKEESDSLFVKQIESGYEEGLNAMRNKPTIIFDFDQTTYDNRATILKERGFSATFAVNPTDTEANKRLVLDGFDLSPYQGLANGSYGAGLTRPTDYTDVSAWRKFIGNLIEKCESLGIYKPISYSCYGHKGGSAIDTVCKEFGIKYVRCGALYGADGETVTEYVPVRTTPDVYHKFPYPIEMHTVDETKGVIDSTITDGNKEIVLMCHKVDGGEGHLSEADFISIVDYVKAKHDAGLVNVLNFHQYYALWYPNENTHDDYCRLLRASMN